MAVNDTELNPQHVEFAEAYLKTFNGTKAAIAAKYSATSAHVTASRLLKNDKIQGYIRARMAEAAMDTNEVLYHLAQIARGDIDDIIDDNGNLDIKKARSVGKTNLIRKIRNRQVTTENSDTFETETEGYDRMRALELIGKHLAMFTDKMQVSMTLEDKLIAGIRSGEVDYEGVLYVYEGDQSLAEQLFAKAGKTVDR